VADRYTHLIERAAARLRQPTTDAAPIVPNQTAPDRQADWRSSVGDGAREGLGGVSTPVRSDEINEHTIHIDTDSLGYAGLIDCTQPYNRIAEEFHIVQHNLVRQSFGANGATLPRGNLVMVTSALKGEGKSFTSINLAGDIARQGDRRVLLVDADPKPDGLGQKLGVSAARGLLDLAQDRKFDVEQFVIGTAAQRLDVLPLGGNQQASAELLSSRRIGEILEQLGTRYADRLIIVDSPPCLSSSSPHALASAVGQVLLVVAANSTQQADVEAALDLVRGCQHVSLLLNKIAPWTGHSFGSYAYPSSQV
jgi:protein-tyrosine kinase